MRSLSIMSLWIAFFATCAQDQASPAQLMSDTPKPHFWIGQAASSPALSKGETIDGIAVHIEDDIILESDVEELAAIQMLLDGKSRARTELVNELIDQWIVRHEAETGNFAEPADANVQAAFARVQQKFSSTKAFEARLKKLGLDDVMVKNELRTQLYLSDFIEYRFRPGVEISDEQVNHYYQSELAPEMANQKQPMTPLTDVASQIRELLAEKEVDRRANDWIAEARSRLRIHVTSGAAGTQ